MDAIVIRELRVEALIGIHRRERHVAQTLSIDLEIGLPSDAVFASDKVADTIDYEQVALRIRALAATDAGESRCKRQSVWLGLCTPRARREASLRHSISMKSSSSSNPIARSASRIRPSRASASRSSSS